MICRSDSVDNFLQPQRVFIRSCGRSQRRDRGLESEASILWPQEPVQFFLSMRGRRSYFIINHQRPPSALEGSRKPHTRHYGSVTAVQSLPLPPRDFTLVHYQRSSAVMSGGIAAALDLYWRMPYASPPVHLRILMLVRSAK